MTALFDNPETLCREIWRDGVLVDAVSINRLVFLEDDESDRLRPFQPGERWASGRVIGDADEVAVSFRPAIRREDIGATDDVKAGGG